MATRCTTAKRRNFWTRLRGAPAPHLVLCGHFHEGTGLVAEGAARFAVCPALCEAPHRYRVVTVSPDGCAIEERALAATSGPAERVLAIDRTGIFTEEPDTASAAYLRRSAATDVFAEARRLGFQPVLVSAWNDPQSVGLAWPDIMKRHDRMFAAMAREGQDPGDGLAICLDETRPLPARLPFEPMSRYGDLRSRLSVIFGVPREAVALLSGDLARRTRFGGPAIASLDGLSSLNPTANITP